MIAEICTEWQSKLKIPSTPSIAAAALETELCPAFFTSHRSIYLEAQGSGRLHVIYLPAHLTKRRCSLLFSCSSIGEFVYSIEGDATLPRPSQLPSSLSQRAVRLSSASLAGRTQAGIKSDAQTVTVWRCQTQEEVEEELNICSVNSTRDQALIHVAQLEMSVKEVERRKLTGTLATAAITKALRGMSLNDQENGSPDSQMPAALFHVTSSSKHFSVPDKILIPSVSDRRSRTSRQSGGSASLLIRFKAKVAGHYPCQIVLWSPHDIRVFHVECIVSQGGAQAELEFTSPALTEVTQNIPIVRIVMFIQFLVY